MTPIDMVREFHNAFCPRNNGTPGVIPPVEVMMVRIQLQQEELGEVVKALAARNLAETLKELCDLEYVLHGSLLAWGLDGLQRWPRSRISVAPVMPELRYLLRPIQEAQVTIARFSAACIVQRAGVAEMALGDLYDVVGTFHELLGFEAIRDAAFAEVHRSNMSKMGEDGKPILSAAGRVVKGPRYSPANMEQFLP